MFNKTQNFQNKIKIYIIRLQHIKKSQTSIQYWHNIHSAEQHIFKTHLLQQCRHYWNFFFVDVYRSMYCSISTKTNTTWMKYYIG